MIDSNPVRPPTFNSSSCMNQNEGGVLQPVVEEEGKEECMGQGGDEEPKDEELEEAREVKGPSIPYTPSRAEVIQHRLQHHPYRSWCPHCVRGKGREDRHSKSNQKDSFGGIPKLASDYFLYWQAKAARQSRKRC